MFWTIDNGVAAGRFERVERHNALDIATVITCTESLRQYAADAIPVVLTGAGPTFCAGFDLTTFADGAEFKQHADRLFDLIEAYPAPIIAALNGPAIGMGCVLASCCDLRVGNHRSWFEVPAARLGVVLDECYVQRLAHRLGLGAAQQLLIASRRIEAERAHQLGVLHDLSDDPVGVAHVWAHHARGVSMESIGAHKSFINRQSVR